MILVAGWWRIRLGSFVNTDIQMQYSITHTKTIRVVGVIVLLFGVPTVHAATPCAASPSDFGDGFVAGVVGERATGLCLNREAFDPDLVTTNTDFGAADAPIATFGVLLPDANTGAESGNTYDAATYMYAVSPNAQISHTTTCPGGTVSAAANNINRVQVPAGSSCLLTMTGAAGVGGVTVTYSGTLSRNVSGDTYSLSAGSVCGAPHVACPTSPVSAHVDNVVFLAGTGFSIGVIVVLMGWRQKRAL